MMPRGKRDPVLLSHAELPSTDGAGPGSGGGGRQSASEEEGHLPGLPRDDLTKSMSGSSVSSYHSALCSEGTETFKDCLEFLDEEGTPLRALTDRAFRSLSGPPGARLDMCSSHTSSSLSNSLSEDGGRPGQWPAAGGESPGTAAALHGRVGWPFPTGVDGELLGLLGKEQFECVDVELESGEARKGHGKKRTVPKRQILLKRKERKEMGFGPWGDGPAPQPLPPTRKEPPSKGRAIGEDFRLNYKQFMKTASLDADASKTRAASCLVKNVLAKKMQYEQRIKMEQKGLRGSSTSSGPSSTGTDLLGDGLEGKSSSLSRSDCSFSAEDLRGATVAMGDATPTHPTKGVVLSEATRENVCKLKTTFNELNERMKYQEVLEGHCLPGATKEPAVERIHYRRARALFEAHPGVGKALDIAPRFERAPKPWPSLKQRAILPSHPQTLPLEADGLALPAVPFTSRGQEVRLVPQSRQEEKPPEVPRRLPSPGTPVVGRRSPAAAKEGSPAQSSAMLWTEKTILLPPLPPSPTEGKDGQGHGGTGGLHAAEGPESTVQQYGCSDGGDPRASPLPGSSVQPQPGKPAERSAPKPPTSEQVSAESSGSAGSTGPTAPFRAGEAGEGPSGWLPEQRDRGPSGGLPEQREAWEHLPKWPAATEPYPPASPAENSNYLAIPVKAPKSPLRPKLPSIPSPASASFGTPSVPNMTNSSFGYPSASSLASTSFGTPLVSNPTSKSFGTPFSIPSPASASFGTPSVPNMTNSSFGYPSASSLASTSFGTPLVSNPTSKSFGTPLIPYLCGPSFGTPLTSNPSSVSFGTPLVPHPSSASFGTPLVPNPSSTSFGTPLVPHPSSASFGTPLVPNPSSTSFGTPLVPHPSSASFGTPLVPNPSSTSFGTPSVPNLANSSLGIPLIPNPASSSFGSPLVTNLVPASLGHPSVPNVASSSFGSPSAPNPAGAPLGTGVPPVASGEAPWSKASPEPSLPRPPEGLVAGERLVPLPPAQPQPHLEDAPHFLRRPDGASPNSKSTPSPTKPFAPHLPAHRRMLVDPDSGKCYYMEPPRQPQLKTLYDPETGQYLEVLIPPVASHAGLYQAPFNPLVMAPGVYGPTYVPCGGFPGLAAPLPPAAPSPAHPNLPAAENPGFSRTFSPAPKGEGPPTAGGPDCGHLESPQHHPRHGRGPLPVAELAKRRGGTGTD
ncbi:PREDICTED: LOW QUALITY PROTEIN: proline-rich basic protein 1 [Aptenodytes forsteri]|uniref:LOW QUALITY PROTEIN: proline-rich basic protein 1 n=1 Tax=Aptenodytes forsteri TaxID=9233 RepID=UPI000904AFAB|nr:PREDICTED: LOW QUALITY PROTEIN: proline-rich basic protein 1 [Aptenodytes forsteri]